VAAADPDCLFCRIVAGDEQAEIVFSDEVSVAFLDIRPVFHGHTLLVTREHYETLPDLPAELIQPYFANVQMLSVAIPDAMGAQGTFVAINNVVSQSVPHLHTHVVPRVKKDGLRGFFWPRTKYERDGHAAETAERIRAAIKAAAAPRS
jgi:histidine triad (HIT) family protein